MEPETVCLLPSGFRIFELDVDVGVSELVAGFLGLILEALEQFSTGSTIFRTTRLQRGGCA
jgi:hypothetical protein